MQRLLRTSLMVLAMSMMYLVGCTGEPATGDNGGGDNGGTTTSRVRVSFDSAGGTYAVAEDDAGNQYTFRTRQESDGSTTVTEANVKTSEGRTLKASLDSQGRPVNFRLSDNTAADLAYDGDAVTIRLTDSEGRLIETESGVGYALAVDRVRARRIANENKRGVRAQRTDSSRTSVLKQGLETYEDIVEAVFDETENPDSPLADNPAASDLKEAAMLIADLASGIDFDEVDRDDLDEEVTLDQVPDKIRQFAGRTYNLFDAEGFCIELTNVANRLTFDNDGNLQSEFDRHLIFPDFGFGGSGDGGLTINHSSGVPVNLTPDPELGFELIVTPIFTGTQLDDNGYITIERRFQGDFAFDTEFFGGTTTAQASRTFDAAFINGQLSDDGAVLEFDLVLIDLADENPVTQFGGLRYHDQNVPAPEREFECDIFTGEHDTASLICPVSVEVGEDFDVEYTFSREDQDRLLDYDWFISEGYGFVVGEEFEHYTTIRATDEGFMEVALIVSDLSDDAERFKVLSCGVNVGRGDDSHVATEDLDFECSQGLNVGEPGYFSVFGSKLSQLEESYWFVFGTSALDTSEPFEFEFKAEFYEPGKFEVAFQGFDSNGAEYWISCDVLVGDIGYDECEANGWYGDGICDEFCHRPDPDCDEFHDMCELNGWYGDGECDDFCPEPDPDCDGVFFDECAEQGWYGDGECDLFCPHPDPDCDVEFYDICAERGWYDNGVCDEICPHPDPDCTGEYDDVCEQNGWYGNGVCDEFCPRPDPDCEEIDICLENGWYGDGECHVFCPSHDPDCGDIATDICEVNGWYGDGVCDQFCPLPDVDCDVFDVCAENGWYGDGQCDELCPEPDPDCDGIDICAVNGWYGDGVCDDCLEPDPDCAP